MSVPGVNAGGIGNTGFRIKNNQYVLMGRNTE